MTTRLYTTRRDAEHAVREQLPDATPALIDLVSAEAWRQQVDVETATRAVEAAGVDCEGY